MMTTTTEEILEDFKDDSWTEEAKAEEIAQLRTERDALRLKLADLEIERARLKNKAVHAAQQLVAEFEALR